MPDQLVWFAGSVYGWLVCRLVWCGLVGAYIPFAALKANSQAIRPQISLLKDHVVRKLFRQVSGDWAWNLSSLVVF